MRKAMLVVAALSVAFLACKSVPAPAPKSEPKKAQKGVASGASVSGLPDGGGSGQASGSSSSPGAGPADGDAWAAKLVEPGAEPRAARRYTFASRKAETRVGRVRVSVTVEAPGVPPQQESEPGFDLTMRLSTEGGGSRGVFPFEVKLEKVALAEGQGLDPRSAAEAQKRLALLAGIAAKLDVTARGQVGELTFAGDEKMAKPGTEEVLQMLQQTLEFVAVPFPEEPIGVGAKWEMASTTAVQGAKVTTVTHFLLKEWTGGGGTVTAEIVRTAPRSPFRDPRMPGAQLTLIGKGRYTFLVKLDRPTQKVSGESSTVATIDVPKSDKGPPQTVVQTIKTKHTLETPAGK